MAERINPPDNDPDPQDRAAVHGQIKPEGRADRDTSPSANDRAGDEKQPGKLRQAVTTTIATGIIGLDIKTSLRVGTIALSKQPKPMTELPPTGKAMPAKCRMIRSYGPQMTTVTSPKPARKPRSLKTACHPAKD
jgi:hypothetical protein